MMGEHACVRLRCDGWWEQRSLGRQHMRHLVIEITDGEIVGDGFDIVGMFLLTGRLGEGGTVAMEKDYFGHTVYYVGTYDGEGTMSGQWFLRYGYDRGRWAIAIRSTDPASNCEIVDLVP